MTQNSGSRRLFNGRELSSGFSATQVTAAFCKALMDISPSCSNAEATLESDKWTITAYLTSTVDNAATVQTALKGLTIATMTTRMTQGFELLGITATGISMAVPTFTVVAAQPYVAATYPSYASPAFDVSFHFAGTATAAALNNQTSTYLHNAVVNAFKATGITDAGVNMRSNMGTGSSWGANCTIATAETSVNATYAILQYLQTTAVGGANAATNTFGALITAELKKEVPTYTNAIQVSDFLINAMPTGANAAGVVVNFTGVMYTGTRLFDIDDDSQDHDNLHEAAAPAVSWTLPVLGVFGLFSLVTLVGMGVRRKNRSTRQINYSAKSGSEDEEQPLVMETLE
jgi:hypothetical protein